MNPLPDNDWSQAEFLFPEAGASPQWWRSPPHIVPETKRSQ